MKFSNITITESHFQLQTVADNDTFTTCLAVEWCRFDGGERLLEIFRVQDQSAIMKLKLTSWGQDNEDVAVRITWELVSDGG